MLLAPSGNVTVCLNGQITLTCSTEGTLLWEGDNINQFFNSLRPPVTEGGFTFAVTSVETRVVGGMTFSEVTSTATLANFQPSQDGLMINCIETLTSLREMAVFKPAGEF